MHAIEFIDVKKEFRDGDEIIQALKPTNLTIEKGELVGVIGPSGSGKSTFLTLAGGLQTPSSGKIIINGQSLHDVSEKKRGKLRFKEIGFVLQTSNLIPFLTVKEQLLLVDKINHNNMPEKAQKIFEQLGIQKLINKYPEELSGGERQRVAIARSLYNDPAIILADEPTASLDSDRAFEVVKILARETKENNKATIMVTHDIRLIDYCDRIFKINDGQLTQEK